MIFIDLRVGNNQRFFSYEPRTYSLVELTENEFVKESRGLAEHTIYGEHLNLYKHIICEMLDSDIDGNVDNETVMTVYMEGYPVEIHHR